MNKRLLKFTLALLLIILLAVLCTNCVKHTYKSYLGLRPCDNPGTQWASEDGDISFHINERTLGEGVMYNSGHSINICVIFDMAVGIYVYDSANVSDTAAEGPIYEIWEGNYTSDHSFVATVIKSTYFDVGDKIEFHRVSN